MSSLSTMSEPRADLARAQVAINAALARFADRHLDGVPDTVRDAIRYSLFGEGKRMRGILVMSAYEAAGGVGDASELAAAVEVVHAYSLVHDDLPCMDDDDMRRGRPTVHKVFGVAAATAAGLAMVPLAALCAADAARALALDDAAVGSIVADLMRASGAGGMIGGQLLDLEGEGRPLALADLERIHRAKTGALITAAATVGGRAASASAEGLAALARYGEAIGLAIQIADDVLDVTATSSTLGKTPGKDAKLGKPTYPMLIGLEAASREAQRLAEQAVAHLAGAGVSSPLLAALARFVAARRS